MEPEPGLKALLYFKIDVLMLNQPSGLGIKLLCTVE